LRLDGYLWRLDGYLWRLDGYLWRLGGYLWRLDARGGGWTPHRLNHVVG
jgi:hypothetical protein